MFAFLFLGFVGHVGFQSAIRQGQTTRVELLGGAAGRQMAILNPPAVQRDRETCFTKPRRDANDRLGDIAGHALDHFGRDEAPGQNSQAAPKPLTWLRLRDPTVRSSVL